MTRLSKAEGTAFLTIRDIAATLRVTERTVRRWIASGELATYRFGGSLRISRQDFEAFIRASRE